MIRQMNMILVEGDERFRTLLGLLLQDHGGCFPVINGFLFRKAIDQVIANADILPPPITSAPLCASVARCLRPNRGIMP